MDDLDRLLAETLRGAAERAPADDELLSRVRARSDRFRRQRIVTGLAAAAVLVVGVPTVVVLADRGSVPGPPPPAAVSQDPPGAVQLVAGFTAPAFPYTLAAVDGMRAPVASMDGGDLIAFFEATELKHHADTTVTVSSRKPTFTGTATETPMSVRGHAGTLRTVDVQPAKKLTLYWQEKAGRWIQLATDDTYTPQQVVALATAMSAASVPVSAPFRLDFSPAGFVTDTVTDSTMTFRKSASSAEALTTVLRKRRSLTGADKTVGPYRAALTHDAAGTTLQIDVTDWNATLEISVSGGLSMSDSELLRFAGGIHLLNRSNPK